MIELCRTDYHFDNWITMQWIIADKTILIFCIIAFISTIQNNVRSAKIDKMKSAASHQDVQHFSQNKFFTAIFSNIQNVRIRFQSPVLSCRMLRNNPQPEHQYQKISRFRSPYRHVPLEDILPDGVPY